MSRQRTIHLSAQALQAIRPNDGLSPRINQIIERYQALMAFNPLDRFKFSGEQRLALRVAMPPASTPTREIRQFLVRGLRENGDDGMAKFIEDLDVLNLLRIVEAMEIEADAENATEAR